MTEPRPIAGLGRHFLLTLQLNFRSRQAIIYGYIVPILFLVAFGGIFRADSPPLFHEMGQLLTITILGGACFGLPTALVAERERGVWRRYRLLPVPTASLVMGTLAARLVIVASAALQQIVLARLMYHTPFPLHLGQALLTFVVVTGSFLGLGLLVAALADDVPAVQALGQCLFLPMIMIGGVGVPLVVLPTWAQKASGFMPGRYAVDLLDRSVSEPLGLHGSWFSFVALAVIGTAAAVVGARLFRWDTTRHISRRGWYGIGAALSAWFVVGGLAMATGQLRSIRPVDEGYEDITDTDVASITYNDLPGDNELVTRLAPPFPNGIRPVRIEALAAWLNTWPQVHTGDPGEDMRHMLSVAAVADIGADLQEAEIGRMIFDEMSRRYRHAQMRQVLAWIILHPDEGTVVTRIPELKLRRGSPSEEMVRQRCALYAKKYLGRLTGAIGAP